MALREGGTVRAATWRVRVARERLTLLREAIPIGERLGHGLVHGLMAATAAIGAYLPTQALGLQEGFWSTLTALAVVQTEFGAVRSTATDQILGAAVGGAVGLGVLLAVGSGLAAYAVAVLLSMLACWGANVASAARIAGVTATLLLLVPHTGSPERMLASRLAEVGWGITVALAVVWAGTWLRLRLEGGAARPDAAIKVTRAAQEAAAASTPSAAPPRSEAAGGHGRPS